MSLLLCSVCLDEAFVCVRAYFRCLRKEKKRKESCMCISSMWRPCTDAVVILDIGGFGQHVLMQRLGRSGTGAMQLLLFWILEDLDNMY